MNWVEVLFTVFGVITLIAGLLVVTTDNLVHAALWLALGLVGLGACYLMVAAEFVAWVQILIYVGAVVVLLLFALMLTRAPTGPVPGLTTRSPVFAAAAATAVAVALIAVLVTGFHGERIDRTGGLVGSARAVGGSLFGVWALPFEILSFILLAALIGAITISRRTAVSGATNGAISEATSGATVGVTSSNPG
jgi:NADH-quinone oxidoreductase subunit J